MKILSLFDYTGTWSAPYREAGYEVIQMDIKLDGQDIRLFESGKIKDVHGVLCAPPCTVFAGSGARWWADRPNEELIEGISLVDSCLRIVHATQPEWWALENPVGRLKNWLGPYKMTFQPWEYGDPYSKKTCLWGEFNTDLQKNIVEPEGNRPGQPNAWYSKVGGKSEKTKEYRSKTPEGFAKAFFEANP